MDRLNALKRIFAAFFAAWVVLWLMFAGRELFVKGAARDYAELLPRPLESKRAHVTGERLYKFLAFAREVMPEGASYELVGLEEGSLDKRRAAYYLYPRVEKDKGDFILVYNKDAALRGKYDEIGNIDASRHILKKKDTP
ncbi:MAG: hypothetical protein JW919_06465 [Candidatus Omnitrophica bacterium]|nr:hypothetical protein [Candidatus Omnitrophota bacterium]